MKWATTNKILWGLAGIPLLALSSNAFADGTPLQVNPKVSSRPGAPSSATTSRSGTADVYVRLINSCYGTNLRSVSNPLAPNSLIEAKLQLSVVDASASEATTVNFWVKYPADLVTAAGMTQEQDRAMASSMYGGVDGMKAGIYGNTVLLTLPAAKANITLNADGSIDTKRHDLSAITIGNPQFNQYVISCDNTVAVYGSAGYSSWQPTYPCGAYMGQDGPLSYAIKSVATASDNSAVDIHVSFPGQTGFCGGYYSPLMLFFDEARPRFTGSSEFQLSAAGKTFWVEAGSPGYFLAMDRNNNKKIDGKEELFGDQDSDKNGFESLALLDSNKDGAIDAKDAKFKNLLLWQDKNGDGISQPNELEPLNKRVTKISLKFSKTLISYGSAAEARQVSEFWFKSGKGKPKKGQVEDIWFAPVPNSSKK